MSNPLNNRMMQCIREPVVREVDPTPRYSASGFGFCARKLYYKVQGIPGVEHTAFDSECRMAVGNTVHEVIQRRLKDKWPDAMIEVECPPIIITSDEVRDVIGEEPHFEDHVTCSCRPDIYLPCPEDEDLEVVVDIKTGNQRFLSAPLKPGYRLQGGVYWRALFVSGVYFLLCDRSAFTMKLVELHDYKEAWADVLRAINFTEKHINILKKPPPIPTHLGRKICEGCAFFRICRTGG